MKHLAYSLLQTKEFDDERRIIRGIATSPVPDRVGDVIEPAGIEVADSIPLFMYHDSRLTVGRAKFFPATRDGVPFEASIPKVAEMGRLRDRVDEAWQMVKYGLITGVSVGFMPDREQVERLKSGGVRFLKTVMLELSLVPVPMHQLATIESIKSADQAFRRAASGALPVVRLDSAGKPGAPGDSGQDVIRRKGVVYLK